MKIRTRSRLIATLALFICTFAAKAQNPPNWTDKQLMEPSVLANEIRDDKHVPYIISVGPGAVIPGSHKTGMASTPEGMIALSALLDSLPNVPVVIYCGCCPFEHCPNVRPAVEALKARAFSRYYLLNLPTNIKTDWINKGYPVEK